MDFYYSSDTTTNYKNLVVPYLLTKTLQQGVLHNGEEIAVKKLYPTQGLDDEGFEKEFNNLMRVQHHNIIRLVGYCYEIRHKYIEMKGYYVLVKIVERALCFEYLQCGSLDKHLSGMICCSITYTMLLHVIIKMIPFVTLSR